MYIKKINNNKYRAKILNEKLNNIDIYNIEEVEKFIKQLVLKLKKKYKVKGELILDIYIDINYGMIIDINIDDYYYDDLINIKINFHIYDIFLYELDYFDITNILKTKDKCIYYYNNKYYIELLSNINKDELHYIFESKNIYYGKISKNIVNNAIKL